MPLASRAQDATNATSTTLPAANDKIFNWVRGIWSEPHCVERAVQMGGQGCIWVTGATHSASLKHTKGQMLVCGLRIQMERHRCIWVTGATHSASLIRSAT